MTTVYGSIPYHVGNKYDGRHLERSSFRAAHGNVPACWQHWSADDVTFTHRALFVAGESGLQIMHTLDDKSDAERHIIQALASGVPLYFSFGVGRAPADVRPAVSEYMSYYESDRPWAPGQRWPDVVIEHIAYVTKPAIDQGAIQIMGL